MNTSSIHIRLIAAAVLCASVGAAPAADGPGARLGKQRVARGLKDVAQSDQRVVDQLTPKLERDAEALQGVVSKYKDRTAGALPELQADLEGVKASLKDTAASITDEKMKARWVEFQDGLLADARDGALNTMADGLAGRLKLDSDQIKSLKPIFKEHLNGLMDVVQRGREAGLDGIPALTESLKRKAADLDTQLAGILKPEQMAELRTARGELREKVFGDIADREVATLVASLGDAPGKAAEIRKVLEADVKAKTKVLETAADEAKDRIQPLKGELDAINRDTRARLKGVVPDADLEKLDTRKRDGDRKVLSADEGRRRRGR